MPCPLVWIVAIHNDNKDFELANLSEKALVIGRRHTKRLGLKDSASFQGLLRVEPVDDRGQAFRNLLFRARRRAIARGSKQIEVVDLVAAAVDNSPLPDINDSLPGVKLDDAARELVEEALAIAFANHEPEVHGTHLLGAAIRRMGVDVELGPLQDRA